MEYAWAPESMTSVGFITLLTLRRIGRSCPSMGQGFEPNRVEPGRSIKLVKADATFDPG
jgi:hypothetical protein